MQLQLGFEVPLEHEHGDVWDQGRDWGTISRKTGCQRVDKYIKILINTPTGTPAPSTATEVLWASQT
jgi:hypothetical protein